MISSLWRSRGEVWSSLWKSCGANSARRGRKRPTARYRPRFECLEARTVPSTVTTQADLIAAINAANAAGGSNTISLGANITLFEAARDNNRDGPNGLPFIKFGDKLTIIGNGFSIQRSSGAGNADFRLFDVAFGATLNLNTLTLQNGLLAGPATTEQGGAIFVETGGTLHLNLVNVTGNTITSTGGTGSITLQGGGIYNAGTATITSSSITGNTALFNLTNAPGNGNNQGDNSTTDGTGNNNGNGLNGDVIVQGAGIYNAGTLTLTLDTFSNNVAKSMVTNGSSTPPGNVGNGNNNGDNDSGMNNGNNNGNGVSGNVTVQGGGLYNAGTATLNAASFMGNVARSAVINGSHNGDGNSQGCTGDSNGDGNGNGVTGNITAAGGGIYNFHILSATGLFLSNNRAVSTVTNGDNNGNNNGVNTNNVDGNDNGDGVDGNITVAGGAIANDANGTATVLLSILTGNRVTSTITNGNNNGDMDGDSNTGNQEGKNNGNAVVGHVTVSGAGIDNDSGGTFSLTLSIVTNNIAMGTVTNGGNNGNGDGNNDGDGDGLASALTVHGGGIRNAGTLSVAQTIFTANTVTATITNGDGNGNNNGNNNMESNDGRANGNGITGDVLVAGGGIASSGMLTLSHGILTGNSVACMIANGSHNGDNNGQGDGSNNNCGNNCGNGVGGNIEVDGGGIGNSGTATVTYSFILHNSVTCTVTLGTDDGVNNGGGSPASTGNDGHGDGNGVHGDVKVLGGGTANVGTLTLVATTIFGNNISANPVSGGGDPTLDGVLVTGAVTQSGINTFG